MSLLPLLRGGVQQQGDGESSSPTLRGRRGNYGGWHCKRVKDNGKVGGQWVVGGEETGTHGRSYYWSAVASSARTFAKISQLPSTYTYQGETNSTDLEKFLWDLFENISTYLLDTQVSIAPTHFRCRLVHSVSVSGPAPSVCWDIWSESLFQGILSFLPFLDTFRT